jgi:UDP-N-acetylmuramate dehydrogenase
MVNVRKLLENSNITAVCPALASRIRWDEPMAGHTTFKLGGPADCFVEPETSRELVFLLEFAYGASIPVSIVGGGSNLLVSDLGIRGIVISLARFDRIERVETGTASKNARDGLPSGMMRDASAPSGCLTSASAPGAGSVSGDTILVRSGAGASMEQLVEWCVGRGIAGLERFAGLPGSVGGAAFMNARCYERSVSDSFFRADVLYFRAGRCTIEEKGFDPAEWDYKRSPFQERDGSDPSRVGCRAAIVLSVTFSLSPGDPGWIRAEMDKYVKDREEKGHFRFPSAGSMFKNNHAFGKPSGKIIDEAGLRGFRIGGAEVAPWHGNLVINAGNATAGEVKTLVDEVRSRVRAGTGFDLEPEVIMAGDWQ